MNAVTIKGVDFDSRYTKLNENQRKAVDQIDGPLLVVAGPGTGKTELLSIRTANILRRTDTLPNNILCLTFTESGASAMRSRLSQIIGADAYKVAIHTFHSFGSEVISQNGEYFYHGAKFRPASELSSYELLREIFDSLDFSNPLSGKLNDEYTHLGDTLQTISELKKSGLTSDELLAVLDANDAVLDACETELADVFATRISKQTISALAPVATRVAALPSLTLPPGINPISSILALSLAHAIDAAEDDDSTKPITAWKNTYLEKDEEGAFVFKDRKRVKKLRAVSYLYYQYLLKMQESELYDFDDMVLRVVHALEVFPDLRFNLQEQYLYIMVDEYQDTNLAQSRILHNLTNGPLGDAPNIMVVGDDDQAIYGFQGAEAGTILSFRDRYETAKIVTLTDNYRSHDSILKHAREVITQAEGRLEQHVPEVDKTLTAHYEPKDHDVTLLEFERIEDERRALVDRVSAQINHGTAPETIAVLARRHHELVSLIPYFNEAGIRLNYERRDNVLDSDVIVQLLLLANVIELLSVGRIQEADAMLPRLLAHPAWGMEPTEVWRLSLAAHKNHGGWLEEMAVRESFVALHTWLITTAQKSLQEPAEYIIDQLIGVPDSTAPGAFRSPLYEYFFSSDKRDSNPEDYLVCLEALRTIRAKLREYRPDRRLMLGDFIEFVQLHQHMGSHITSVRVRSDADAGAVNLMTAHKSKGLQFEHVHIFGAVDTSWGERVRTRSRLIGYPANLPLVPSGDSPSERIRLFFVAMTRARSTLSISYSLQNDQAKPLERASFLHGVGLEPVMVAATEDTRELTEQLEQEWYQPLVNVSHDTMEHLLRPTLESYKLSATHLNAFIDVTGGGPTQFLLTNLLRFPRAMSPQSAFGSAIHRTLQRAHGHLTVEGIKKPVEDVLQEFEGFLSEYHLSEADFEPYLKRGHDHLRRFLDANYDSFDARQRTEVNFAGQQSMLGDAHLTGALDLIDIDPATKHMTVTDYKTGKPATSWNGKTEWEKIKLHKYKQQLMFYKLLVEHARDYQGIVVETGVLQFIEPTVSGSVVSIDIAFDDVDLAEFTKLICAVHAHIVRLDLPDTSQYPQTLAGIQSFEQYLIDTAIDE